MHAARLRAIGETALADGRQSFATLSDELQALATARNPSELMEAQERLARRNAELAFGSLARTGRAFGDLAESIFTPLSARMKANIEAFRTIV